MAVLKKVGDPSDQFLPVAEPETAIGRQPDCHIVLALNGVSRLHAYIRRKDNRYVLVDNGSRNYTFLHDQRLDALIEHPLRHADRFKICDVEFIFYERQPPPPSAPEMKVVPDAGGVTGSTVHTLDASQSSSAMLIKARPEEKLKAILEITNNLASALSIDAVAPKVLESLFNIFPQAERGLVVLKAEGSDRLEIKGSKQRQIRGPRPFAAPLGPPQDDEPSVSISRTLVNMVLTQKQAVLSQDAGSLPTSASIAEMRIQSIMCVPIITPDDRAIGLLQLDTSHAKQFANEDLEILSTVARQAAIAISNAQQMERRLRSEIIERQLKIAAEVQAAMLPKHPPKLAGWKFFAHYDATYAVGGDFYDLVKLPDGRVAVAVGDVAGKGIAAAMIMAKFCGDNRMFMLSEGQPAAAAAKLNEAFNNAGIEDKFLTLSLSFIDPVTKRVRFTAAGHFALLIRRADGTVEEVGDEACGLGIGVDWDSVYKEAEVGLEVGDVVVVYSDGVTDAQDPDGGMYHTIDHPRLFRRLRELGGGPEAVGRGIIQAIREFTAGAPQADDITIVCYGRADG